MAHSTSSNLVLLFVLQLWLHRLRELVLGFLAWFPKEKAPLKSQRSQLVFNYLLLSLDLIQGGLPQYWEFQIQKAQYSHHHHHPVHQLIVAAGLIGQICLGLVAWYMSLPFWGLVSKLTQLSTRHHLSKNRPHLNSRGQCPLWWFSPI